MLYNLIRIVWKTQAMPNAWVNDYLCQLSRKEIPRNVTTIEVDSLQSATFLNKTLKKYTNAILEGDDF